MTNKSVNNQWYKMYFLVKLYLYIHVLQCILHTYELILRAIASSQFPEMWTMIRVSHMTFTSRETVNLLSLEKPVYKYFIKPKI